MCASPRGGLTREVAFPLYAAILAFDAEQYVEGHHPSVVSRREMELLVGKMHAAAKAVDEGVAIPAPDDDTAYFVEAFTAGTSPA